MKISFTATQNGLTARQWTRVWDELIAAKPSAVIHGACKGGDDEIDDVCLRLGIQRVVFPSDHPTKSRLQRCVERGGKIIVAREPMFSLARNPLIVDAGDRLIACPSQARMIVRSGTWATVRYARKKHVNVLIIEP